MALAGKHRSHNVQSLAEKRTYLAPQFTPAEKCSQNHWTRDAAWIGRRR
jgi:hypothetical protein